MDASEAIARAKAIAARLAGTNADADTKKRGVEEALASLIPGLGESKRARTSSCECTKKIAIPQDENPGYNYVGLLIGPGGSKQRELVAASGGDVKISIRGSKATGGGPEAAGGSEEPLHVLLEGSTSCVTKAEVLVRELLEDSDAADKEKARQLSIVGGGDSGYTPKPVAQLLGLGGTGSTPASAYGPQPGEDSVEEKIGVPNNIVGLIIGRGGESITSMQRRTGCRVQIQKEHEMAPGTTQRVITLTATTPEAIAQCRAIIEGMVKERIQATGSHATAAGLLSTTGVGSTAMAQMAQLQQALAEGQSHITVQVPDADVGLIIGKGGAQIRNIQEKSGANVQIPQVADAGNPTVRTVNITHPNMEGANFAKQMIEEVLASKAANQMGGGNQEVTIQVNCPDKDVGMIIGRGGCVIKQMQTSTRCRIQIPPTAPPGSMYRVISVIGNAASCQQVKQMIETIVAEQSSQSVMSGVGFATSNPYGQQQAYGQQNYYGQQPTDAYGQQDYSAQWAAYYAAQAAAQGGDATATATPAATATAPAPAGETPAYDAYYEVFWQYASYYGEEAARKHYGAWSPPEGTPNPNLANGAAATAAPTPAAAATQSADTATTQAATTEIKDSSVRKVSNLPAWMSKS